MRVSLKLVMVGVPLVAVIVTASVFGVLSYRFASASLDSSIAATLSSAATARRDAIAQRHEFWHRRAETLAGDAEIADWIPRAARGADEPPPRALAKAAAPHQREVLAAVALDRRGRVLFTSAQHGVDVAPWLAAMSVRRIRQVTDVGARRTEFGSAVGVVVPVGRGRVAGFLLLLFDMDGVFELTRDYSGLGVTGETVIVRVEGRDRLRHISPTRFRRDAALAPVVRAGGEDGAQTSESRGGHRTGTSVETLLEIVATGRVGVLADYRGRNTYAAARHVEGIDWIVLAKIDVDEARGALQRLLGAFGVAGVVLIVLIMALALAFCANALRQTRALKHAATQLGDADYSGEAPSGSVIELNALATAFNRMRDSILSALERERAARKAANAASDAKSRFLATMSHEIRTPMNGVIGAADLLSTTAQDANQRYLTETIVSSGKALLSLINDVLDFSRLEARELVLAAEPFCPRQNLEGVAAQAARIAETKDLPVVLDIDPSADPPLLGDEARLRQILVNLVGNAVKFTTAGHVLVSASAAESGLLRVTVLDTGPGIPADRLSSIFDAFDQVDNSVSRDFEGTGLGLAISRSLARAMGGEIEVASTLGEGASFTLHVPLTRAPREDAPEPPTLDGVAVALRDPLAPAAASLTRLLHQAGATVVEGPELSRADAVIVADLATADTVRQLAPGAAIILHGTVNADVFAAEREGRLSAVLPRPAPAHRILEVLSAQRPLSRPAPDPAPAGDAPRQLSGLNILVAEDNRVNRVIVERMLSQMGASVALFDDGAAALDAIQRAQPDLVLLDVSMPVMDGLQVLDKIRALPGTRSETPVIMLTAHEGPEIRENARAADGFMTKPIRKRTLLEGILAVLSSQRADEPIAP